ncbi:MAG TPA: GNAT family N-acetyltransferase [Sandaracinaceae bacterium LLY-WYZ-13_1]|nr:GNAT family N-acetyltransferase [Sandaracinaceae bacterium LLY-WYZ-13_1]
MDGHRSELPLDDPGRAGRVEAALVRAGVAEVVDLEDGAATRRWAACDLASMVEGCFHRRLRPEALGDAEARGWVDRLGGSYLWPGFADDAWMTRYLWLVRDGARVGTLALPATAVGTRDLRLWSLYVHPAHRGRGHATAALRAAFDAAVASGFRGIRVDTHWAWQRTLRFYLDRRMWVVSWKRSVGLAWRAGLPGWALEEGPDRLALRVPGDGAPRRVTAHRRGRSVALSGWPPGDEGLGRLARSTLALELALRGWPLGDPAEAPGALGTTTGLAARIRRFEAASRELGWTVRTPAIPGVCEG